jgi:type VI secretion system secreted protein VgrG
MPAQDESPFYENDFTAIPHERVARGRPPAQKPVVRGPLTAMVVGPGNEEIHTDKYGRVRLQFHWDRHGDANEKSSCFVRVAQGLAGSGWGMVFVPRVGMEVVVQFLDGDPDKPLVTGAVYNETNKPPWTLPKNGSKSGLLTRSSKNGSAETANELSFEDKKGDEKILLHAEKDFLREVENDETVKIGHHRTLTDENDRTATVSKGNDKLTISQGNQQITISQGNQTVKLDLGSVTMDAANGITLKCGESTIKLSQQGIEIKGIEIKVAGMSKAETKAPMVDISADAMANIKGGMVKIN